MKKLLQFFIALATASFYANAPSMIDMLRTNLKPLFFMLWQCRHKDFQLK